MTRTSWIGKPASAPSVSTWRTPFSTAGMYCPGIAPPIDVVHELEARAAVERLDAQVHLAELSGAAGLLLVPAVTFGGPRNGLAVGNARRVGLHVHAVALAHALQQHAQVELAHAVKHRLVHRRVMLDAHARILGGELVERVGEALLIAAALGLDGEPQHRRRKGHGLEVILVLIVRVMQHGIQMQLIHLGDGADVAGNRLRDFRRVLAEQLVQVRDLDGLARIADEQLAAGTHGALMHAQHAELADVRIDGDLEHVGDHVLSRIGADRHAGGAVAAALEKRRRIAFGRVGHQPLEHLQQLGYACAALG